MAHRLCMSCFVVPFGIAPPSIAGSPAERPVQNERPPRRAQRASVAGRPDGLRETVEAVVVRHATVDILAGRAPRDVRTPVLIEHTSANRRVGDPVALVVTLPIDPAAG